MNICLSIVVALMFLINLWLFSIRNINAPMWKDLEDPQLKGLHSSRGENSLTTTGVYPLLFWTLSCSTTSLRCASFWHLNLLGGEKLWPFPAGLSSRTSRPKHSSRDGKTGEKMFIKTQSSIQKMIRRNPETNVTRRVTTVYRPKILCYPEEASIWPLK